MPSESGLAASMGLGMKNRTSQGSASGVVQSSMPTIAPRESTAKRASTPDTDDSRMSTESPWTASANAVGSRGAVPQYVVPPKACGPPSTNRRHSSNAANMPPLPGGLGLESKSPLASTAVVPVGRSIVPRASESSMRNGCPVASKPTISHGPRRAAKSPCTAICSATRLRSKELKWWFANPGRSS